MTLRHYRILIAAVALSAGCASAGGSARADAVERGSSNVITQAEIERSGATTAMQAIRQIRPSMLRTNAITIQGADPGVVVYSDGMKLGGTETLDQLSVSDIKRIEYLSATDATQRFGTGHPHGAILLTRK